MQKNPLSESGFFNLRVLMAVSLCSLGVSLAIFSFAATPSSGTLTDTSGPLTYGAGPFFVANPTPILFLDQGPECFGSAQPCDDYVLTATLPAGYTAMHPNASVKVTLGWTDAGSGASDYDLYIYRGIVHNTDGSQAADYQSASSANPECCEALWEDKSALTTNIGLDPILFTDQHTGRTFASNSTVGANAVYAYSDNDGDLWIEAGFSPPDGGVDHESIGSGPYPDALSALRNQINQGQAVYYCSQDIVGPAACQRSDTLGASYGPGVLAYDGITTQCGGLHGHVHVAPNGTVWLPVRHCGGTQGGAVSTDGATTWKDFLVTK